MFRRRQKRLLLPTDQTDFLPQKLLSRSAIPSLGQTTAVATCGWHRPNIRRILFIQALRLLSIVATRPTYLLTSAKTAIPTALPSAKRALGAITTTAIRASSARL